MQGYSRLDRPGYPKLRGAVEAFGGRRIFEEPLQLNENKMYQENKFSYQHPSVISFVLFNNLPTVSEGVFKTHVKFVLVSNGILNFNQKKTLQKKNSCGTLGPLSPLQLNHFSFHYYIFN